MKMKLTDFKFEIEDFNIPNIPLSQETMLN